MNIALIYIVCFLRYYMHDSIVFITNCFITLLQHVRGQSALCCQINGCIGPKSRTERHRKTKVGTEVAHVTRDSDATFKVSQKVKGQGHRGVLWRPPAYSLFNIRPDLGLPASLHSLHEATDLSFSSSNS